HRIQHSGCDRDTRRIIDEGEEQVLPDVRHGRVREAARAHDAGEIAFYERDARAFHRDVRARAHGNADVGGGKGRGVVHAVAGHRNDASLVAQHFDDLLLVLGQDLRVNLVNAELPRDRLGGGAVIAGEHDDADAFAVQRLQRLGRRPLYGIGDGEDARDLAIHGGEDRGRAIGAELVGYVRERVRGDADLHQILRVAERDCLALDLADDTLADGRVEAAHLV